MDLTKTVIDDTLREFLTDWHNANPFLQVHTSGSTGKPKNILVEKSRMLASAKMTCDYLNLKKGDTTLLCMSLSYIGGKMIVVRAIERDMRLLCVPPCSTPLDTLQDICKGEFPHINMAAMVPMQVKKSLDNPHLREIDNLIIGGGAIDKSLEQTLKTFSNNVYSTYGMTETLSHIALRKVSGDDATPWYTPLRGVTISVNEDNCLVIEAPLLCDGTLVTNDIVEITDGGRFRIIGRKDNVINSGGIKIHMEEVEKAIRERSGVDDGFMISSCKDEILGEKVTLILSSHIENHARERVVNAANEIEKYWRPKKTVEVDELPMTDNGKPDRATAKKIASL